MRCARSLPVAPRFNQNNHLHPLQASFRYPQSVGTQRIHLADTGRSPRSGVGYLGKGYDWGLTASNRQVTLVVMQRLTPKQRAFVAAVMAGCNHARAAEVAGYAGTTGEKGSLKVRGHAVAHSPAVIAELARLRRPIEFRHTLTRDKLLARMEEIVDSGKAADKVQAGRLASRILGYDAPQQVEVKVEGSLLWRIRNKVGQQRRELGAGGAQP